MRTPSRRRPYSAAAALFFFVAVPRFRQGWAVLSYQRKLKRLRHYAITLHNIPVSNKKLFLGRGFRWEPIHTQRPRDTQKPEVRKYVQPGRICAWARRMEVAWERTFLLKHLASLFAKDRWWNPMRPLVQTGGKALLNAIEPRQESVFMDLGERVGHTLVLGTPRSDRPV